MPSTTYKCERGLAVLIVSLLFLALTASFALAATASSGGQTGTTDETAERIRVLEAQRIRQDERTSLWGGTGLAFTRTAYLLPRKHLSVSSYFNYSSYQYVQGWREAYKLDDPRGNDYEMQFVANYGLTHWAEVGLFMNVFMDSEQSDANQLHMREAGIGWSGVDGKFRLMDVDKDGLGIATTFFLRFPSPQQNADITSDELGYGAELNMSLKLAVISEWLDKFIIHGNLGWAYIDYFDTQLAGLYQFARSSESLLNYYKNLPGKYRGDYKYSDLFDPSWGIDDVEMKKTYFGAEHYTGSIALEYRPAPGISTGLELVGYRMVDFSDDNLQLAPFVTYTLREIPFLKNVHKDLITATAAGNYGLRATNRSAPEWGVLLGLTWHTNLIF